MDLVTVIISGGSGSRLWPLSTKDKPKPFVELFKDGNLLEKTIARAKNISSKLLFVCNKKHLALHQKAIQNSGLTCYFLLEEEGKNTAPAILMAARFLQKKGLSDVVLLVLPADQFILEQDKFEKAVQIAKIRAQKGGLITFGICPSYPETGYGYLHLEAGAGDLVCVKEFVEKPDLPKAKEFLRQKNYFWNSGIFCFSLRSGLQAFEKHQPQMSEVSLQCIEKSTQIDNRIFFDAETFGAFEAISMDYAIMEKHQEVFAVKTNFQWSDIGSWYSAAKLFPKDKKDNVLQGDYFELNNKNTFLLARNNFFGLLGLENISIVESPQGILIAHNSKLQEVKKIFEYINSPKRKTSVIKKLALAPEILQVTLECNQNYQFRTEENCNIINASSQPAVLFVDEKSITLRASEGIFLKKETQVFLENKNTQTQKWIKIQSQKQE
jgi:mannose-1-phosphate guanylyltransferase/mannose-6-phosphate isomerase